MTSIVYCKVSHEHFNLIDTYQNRRNLEGGVQFFDRLGISGIRRFPTSRGQGPSVGTHWVVRAY